jgi:hypothetical protein
MDVKNGMIIDAPPQCEYLALSYVWGKVHEDEDYLGLWKANHSIWGELERYSIKRSLF